MPLLRGLVADDRKPVTSYKEGKVRFGSVYGP